MHTAVKIVLGIVLLIGGVAWTYFFLHDFISVIKGVVGPIVAVIGLFVVWLELDELRIQRELEIEEKKAEKKEKKEK